MPSSDPTVDLGMTSRSDSNAAPDRRGGRRERRERPLPMPKYHPDDPRGYCHCRLIRRPVWECETGVCLRVPQSTRKWNSTILEAEADPGIGEGNKWRMTPSDAP